MIIFVAPHSADTTLRIRLSQIDILSDAAEKRWHVRHLRRYFSRFADWSNDALLDFVAYGQQRASAYGIRSAKGVSRYLNVMAAHGQDFDRAENCRWWASAVLRSAGTMDEDRLTGFLARSALSALRPG